MTVQLLFEGIEHNRNICRADLNSLNSLTNKFNTIAHICWFFKVKEEYDKLRPDPGLEKDIEKHSGGGKLTAGLKVMLHNIKDQPGYFADEIEGAVEKLVGPGIKVHIHLSWWTKT